MIELLNRRNYDWDISRYVMFSSHFSVIGGGIAILGVGTVEVKLDYHGWVGVSRPMMVREKLRGGKSKSL